MTEPIDGFWGEGGGSYGRGLVVTKTGIYLKCANSVRSVDAAMSKGTFLSHAFLWALSQMNMWNILHGVQDYK